MNKDNKEGTSLTIDSKGNITPKPYGASRWAQPRKYDCGHTDCNAAASLLLAGCPDQPFAHHCCAFHREGPVQ